MLEALDTLGRASGEWLWMPILAWTALWLTAELTNQWSARLHPLVRYRATQAALFALPLGLALTPFLDASRIAPWLNPPVVIDVAPLAQALTEVPPEAAVVLPMRSTLTPWAVLGLILLGLAVFACVRLWRLGGQALTLRRLRRALPPPDPTLADETRAIAQKMGVHSAIRVIDTPEAPVPMTFGLWRPVVVLPTGMGDAPRELALKHELVHVRRRDALAAGAEALTFSLLGFHPGVARLVRRCALLREMACDAALLTDREVNPGTYALLVSRFATPAARFAAVGMADSPSHVRQRINAMTRQHSLLSRSALAIGWTLSVVLLVGASLAITASRALAQEPRIIIERSNVQPIVVEGQAREKPQTVDNVEIIFESEDGTVSFLKDDSGGTPLVDSVVVEGSFIFNELEPRLLELQERLEPEVRNIIGRLRPLVSGVENHRFEVNTQFEVVDGTVLEIVEGKASGAARRSDVFEVRTDSSRTVLGSLMRLTEQIQSIQISPDGTERVITITDEDGTVREFRLSGEVSRPVRLGTLAPEANKTAQEPLAPVASPNPATNAVTIRFAMEEAGMARFRLYDLTGRLVVERDVQRGVGMQSLNVNVSTLSPGAYIYRLEGAGEPQTGRFTVAR